MLDDDSAEYKRAQRHRLSPFSALIPNPTAVDLKGKTDEKGISGLGRLGWP